jgi:NAD(P)-dependent dehydrogenase (short-subunit alcohol dehydrogenase family)
MWSKLSLATQCERIVESRTAVWLFSPEAPFVTGAALPVDGGMAAE